MIAAALGGEVYPGPVKEVGFSPVTVHEAACQGPLRHIVDVPVLHWHGDTFTLPDNVELIASSPRYPHQAFRRGGNLLALQFHAEMGLDPRFEAWLEQSPDTVAEVGGEAKLRAEHAAFGPGAVAAGQAMIAEWLEGLR